MSPFIRLIGESNTEYVFTVLPLNRKMPDSAGVYVVTRMVSNSKGQIHHCPVMVGSCEDLSVLFDESAIRELKNDGAHFICLKIEEIPENRRQIEQDLKAKYHS